MKQLIFKLGSNVKRSLRFFIVGLVLGVISAALIYHGYYHQHYYQIVGLVILVPAVICLFYGYIGLLANRISQIIQGIIDKRQRNKELYQDIDS